MARRWVYRPVRMKDFTTALLGLLGVTGVAVGLFAYLAPQGFFELFAVYTGDLNEHLVRDVGAAYAAAGFALSWAAAAPRWRAPLVTVAAVFFLLHALAHVLDLVSGSVGIDHLLADAWQVFLPAAVLCWLAVHCLRHADS